MNQNQDPLTEEPRFEALEEEVAAMREVARLLDPLPKASRERVLSWAKESMLPHLDPWEHASGMTKLLGDVVNSVRNHKDNTDLPRESDKNLWNSVRKHGIDV